jgi:hypothetical protein
MSTVTEVVTSVVTTTAAAASASSTLRARPQGGILEGEDPSVYDSKNPIILFIIQVRYLELPARLSISALTSFYRPASSSYSVVSCTGLSLAFDNLALLPKSSVVSC